MFRLEGKSALVTGASGGIGAGIARALHAQGATVALSGTRRDALDALATELGERVAVCPADLRDPAAADALIAAAEAACGPLAILVNNAGLTKDGLAMRMKDEDWAVVLDVDLAAPFRLARAVLRGMIKRRAGRIIGIGRRRRRDRQSRPGQLRGGQGRASGHEQGAGTGGRQPWHHGQRHRAGLY